MSVIDHTASGNRWIPSRLSPVIKLQALMLDAIKAYRISSYEAFAFDMTVTVATESESDYGVQSGRGLGYVGLHIFYICPEGKESSKVAARFKDKDGTVEIRFMKKAAFRKHSHWMSFGHYLSRHKHDIIYHPNRETNLDRRDQFNFRNQHQVDWWAANGKTFDFLVLPRELRNVIYVHFIGSHIQTSRKRSIRAAELDTTTVSDLALLYVSKQICEEIREQVFVSNFYVDDSRFLVKIVRGRNFPIERLRHLTLALGVRGYFRLCGLFWSDTEGIVNVKENYLHHSELACLRKVSLLSVTLVMPDFSREPKVVPWADERFSPRTVVDLILETVWPHVRGHPIKVTGCVETDQKLEFEEMARVEYEKKVAAREEAKGEHSGTCCCGSFED